MRSNPAACGRTGALLPTKTCLICCRIMNLLSGAVVKALESLWDQENSDPGKVAQVIVRLASCDHLPAHLLWAATPFGTPQKPKRLAQPTQRNGETSASRPT